MPDSTMTRARDVPQIRWWVGVVQAPDWAGSDPGKDPGAQAKIVPPSAEGPQIAPGLLSSTNEK